MIADKLTEPVFWLLAAAAILNLTQKRYHKTCMKKRTATLVWAILVFVFYVVVVLVATNEKLPDYFLLIGLAIVAVGGYIFREKAFPYKLKCISCQTRLSFTRILYHDSNMCEKCDPPVTESVEEVPKHSVPKADDAVTVPDSVDDVDWEDWEFTEQAVICYIKDEQNNQVLLINKKTGLGAGKVNAPGGRIEAGEMPVETVVRECREEVGLTPLEPKHVGDLFFIFKNGYSLRGFVYTAEKHEGNMIETVEAEPFWCDMSRIPYGKMWADDELWLDKALKGIKISGKFIFDEDEMLSHDVYTVEEE